MEQRRRYDRVKTIFRPLEDYIVASYGDYRCLNSSFSTARPTHPGRAQSESNIVTPPPEPADDLKLSPIDLSQIDGKTLLLGDIGENSTWWTGKLGRNTSDKAFKRKRIGEGSKRTVSSKSPNINWTDVNKWYELVHTAGDDWQTKMHLLKGDAPGFALERLEGFTNIEDIEDDLVEAREHTIRALLKVTENVLKRPSRPLNEPNDLRFLLIVLANPSLYPSSPKRRRAVSYGMEGAGRTPSGKQRMSYAGSPKKLSPQKSTGREGPPHTGLLKRVLGLLANSTDACHRYLIGWFSRFNEEHLTKIVDAVASFVTHRIARRSNRPHSKSMLADGGLIPDLSGSAMSTSAQLHSAMGLSGSVKKAGNDSDQEPSYAGDWQVKAAAKLMSLLFAANNIWQGKRRRGDERLDSALSASPQARAKRSGQLMHTSSFYNTLLDYQDMIADFKVWNRSEINSPSASTLCFSLWAPRSRSWNTTLGDRWRSRREKRTSTP